MSRASHQLRIGFHRFFPVILFNLLILFTMQISIGAAGPVKKTQTGPAVEVISSSGSEAILSITIPEISIESVECEGRTLQTLRVPGAGFAIEPGMPELPVFARFLAVTPGTEIDVILEGSRRETLSDIRLRCYEEASQKGTGTDIEFSDLDTLYPSAAVETGPAVQVRDQCLIPLIIHPARYNPGRREAVLYRTLRVRLNIRGGTIIPPGSTAGSSRSEAFSKLLTSLDLSGSQTVPASDKVRGGYLIITPDEYLDTLTPLIQWKRQKGHPTDVVTLSQIGANPDNFQIKEYIQDYYDHVDHPLEYIILIGDDIDVWGYYYTDEMEPVGWDITDHPFSMLEGDDYFSDAFVGRLSVEGSNQLRTVINKIISYERDPFMEDTEWYQRALLVCNYEFNQSARSNNIWVMNKLLENGYTDIDTSFIPSIYYCDAGFIASSINTGVSFVNYRGFMDWGGWTVSWPPPPDHSNIYRLNNGFMLPVITDMVCGATSFFADCPAEAWLRAGTISTPRGGIAVVGPSGTNTKVYFNNVLDAGFYAGIFDDGLFTVGQALARAKMELYMQYPLNRGPGHAWNSVECYYHMYNIIGDPGLHMWTGIPRYLSVEHPESIPSGTSVVTVTVRGGDDSSVEGAYACLTCDDQILAGGFTSDDGNADLKVIVDEGDSLLITVTGHNFKPYQEYIPSASAASHISLFQCAVDDDSTGSSAGNGDGEVSPGETIEFHVNLENTGSSGTAANVTAEMTSADPNVTIIQGTARFGDIRAGRSAEGETPFLFEVAPGCPDGTLITLALRITDSESHEWKEMCELQVRAPQYALVTLTIDDRGEILPNGLMDPGETVQMTVDILNEGHLPGEDVQAFLDTDVDFITFIDGAASFGTVEAGKEGSNEDDPFFLSSDLRAFKGQLVIVNLILLSNTSMNDTVVIPLNLGAISDTDPVGPDQYGYYAFENSDWYHAEKPNYDWIEIDPAFGGQGTILDLTDVSMYEYGSPDYPQGDSEILDLPFDFQYYGSTYDQVTVCSNGWLSMGSSWMNTFRNWSIPAVLNPPCLVAPFWDDLYTGGGHVVYHHDTNRHRFIVEWSRVRNDYDGSLENFEVILFDPESYPTTTGDGEILFQYQTVNNVDYAFNFATVGIESPDKATGINYSYAGLYSQGAHELTDGLAIKFTTNTGLSEEAYLNFYGCLVDDDALGQSSGDGDGSIDAGEQIELTLRLINYGQQSAENVTAALSTSDPALNIVTAYQTYPDIAQGDTALSEGPFIVSIAPDCEHGHIIHMAIDTESSGEFCSRTEFGIDVSAPVINYAAHSHRTVEGDSDPRPEEGETVELSLQISNNGADQAVGVYGRLTTDDQSITILDDTAVFGDLQPDSVGTNHSDPFLFMVNQGAEYHTGLFTVTIFCNEDHYQTELSCSIEIEREDVLLVDDDGGEALEVYFRQALDMIDATSWRYDRMVYDTLDPYLAEDYETVVWFTGEERESTLTPADRLWLENFLDAGGRLFLTGQNIAAELAGSPFLSDYLHAECIQDNSEEEWICGVPGDNVFGEYSLMSLPTGNYGANNQTSPDEIEPLDGASPMATYFSSQRTAALRYMDGYRLVYFAFGFESVIDFYDVTRADTTRAEIMEDILDWFQFEPHPGDVNEDGEVNILDVVAAVNFILEIGSSPTLYQLWAADVTGDGQINIIDVINIVNDILTGRTEEAAHTKEKRGLFPTVENKPGGSQ